MKTTKFLIASTLISGLTFTSCKKDETETTEENQYSVPSTYTFTDDAGNNTVSFSGQTERMDMLGELTNTLKSANTAGTSISAADLKNMYNNTNSPFSDADLNASSKNLASKTAYNGADGSADATTKQKFEAFMDSIALLSANTTSNVEDGEPGTAGIWPVDGGGKGPYLMDENGVEYTQYIEKGLMGAVFASQMTVHYLQTVKDDDNSTAKDPDNGKYYTEMEHHWDEAYGYFTSATDFPQNGAVYWGKYALGRESLIGSATKIAEAFRTGRAAISNQDYTARDEQADIICDEMEKLQAATVIHYFNSAIDNFNTEATKMHALSEAYAFLDGMRYGYNAISGDGVSSTEIDTILAIFEDFTSVSVLELNQAKNELSSKVGLDDVKDSL